MRLVICTFAFVCLIATGIAAQTSIGFADDSGLSELLAYRLPDWGWRTWDVDGEFRGAGHSRKASFGYNEERQSDLNSNLLSLASDFNLDQEGESHDLAVHVFCEGSWQRRRDGLGERVEHDLTLVGAYEVSARGRLYLAQSRWFLTAFLGSVGTYEERRWDRRYGDQFDEGTSIRNSGGHAGALGAGVGRLRDVTPLVRALRLSERLNALGRPRLTAEQVQHVARVLAREYGYRQVYERPDRRFWRDVLDPLLEGGPLSVAEIFYLTDVMQEDLAGRRQGARLQAEATWYKGGADDEAVYETRYELLGEVSRNLSLSHQISGYLDGAWMTVNGPGEDFHRWWGAAGGTYLWNVADRLRLEGELWGSLERQEPEGIDHSLKRARVGADLTLDIHVEDVFVLRPYLGAAWTEQKVDGEWDSYDRLWSWHYGVAINYRLDRVLL